DNLIDLCADYICRQKNEEYIGDGKLGYGKGIDILALKVRSILTAFAQLPYGLILISHSDRKEIETRTGKITKSMPVLPKKSRDAVLGFVDIVLFATVSNAKDDEGSSTIIHTKPNRYFDAGDRTGRLPRVLPLNYKAFKEAYEKGAKNDTGK
ncbi:unnamed protein product, partial [marine sediment metagenome]